MVNWTYNAEEGKKEMEYSVIPVGNYRARIVEAVEQKSKSGNDVIRLNLAISGYTSRIYFYIVFLTDNTAVTNQRLAQLWDSFNMPVGTLDVNRMVGCEGGVKIKHELYNGEAQAKVHYLLKRGQVENLPAYIEGNGSVTGASLDVTSNDLPF